MKKLTALVIAVAAALIFSIGLVDAVEGNGGEDTHPTGVQYTWGAADGQLSIIAAPDEPYEAYDASGRIVASGLIDAPCVMVLAPHAGFGADGVILKVRVGPDVLAVTDPEWEWN